MGRDKHEQNRKQKWRPHVRLYKTLLNSAAWQSLSPVARSLYVQVSLRYTGTNNGAIPYSVRDGQDELHIGKSTAHRGLAELVQRGFMVAMKRGTFSLKLKHATEWLLTEWPSDLSREAPTRDYFKWPPENLNTVPVVGPSVPVEGPLGTPSGTDVAEKARNGTYSGTVNAKKRDRRYLLGDTNNIPSTGGLGVGGRVSDDKGSEGKGTVVRAGDQTSEVVWDNGRRQTVLNSSLNPGD